MFAHGAGISNSQLAKRPALPKRLARALPDQAVITVLSEPDQYEELERYRNGKRVLSVGSAAKAWLIRGKKHVVCEDAGTLARDQFGVRSTDLVKLGLRESFASEHLRYAARHSKPRLQLYTRRGERTGIEALRGLRSTPND